MICILLLVYINLQKKNKFLDKLKINDFNVEWYLSIFYGLMLIKVDNYYGITF